MLASGVQVFLYFIVIVVRLDTLQVDIAILSIFARTRWWLSSVIKSGRMDELRSRIRLLGLRRRVPWRYTIAGILTMSPLPHIGIACLYMVSDGN